MYDDYFLIMLFSRLNCISSGYLNSTDLYFSTDHHPGKNGNAIGRMIMLTMVAITIRGKPAFT